MEIIKNSIAGTLESSDIQIIIEPSSTGIQIEIESPVMGQFGNAIKREIEETLERLQVKSIKLYAKDKGAISEVIRSRVETACFRGSNSKKY